MKKKILFIAFISLLSASAFGQAPSKDTTQKPQPFTVSGDLQTFQVLLYVLDNPDKALHKDVKALEAWITNQLSAQLPKQKNPPPRK